MKLFVALLCALVALAGCATTVDVAVLDNPEVRASERVDASDGDAEAREAAQPTAAVPPAATTPLPTPTAPPTPTEAPTATAVPPTPVPELPYETAIEVYFADIERYWSQQAQPVFGVEFTPVAQKVPYDPGDVESIPTCAGERGPAALYADNAFYCPADDLIAWDNVGLFPDLYRDFGDFALGLVAAHEYAHALQVRADVAGPTIYIELQADCLAGAWATNAAGAETAPVTATDLDSAVGGLLTFADPLGTPAGDPSAHGTAFDRLNAFVEGFEGGAEACLDYVNNPPQTTSLPVDLLDSNDGDLPLEELLPIVEADMGLWLASLAATQLGPDYRLPGRASDFGAAGTVSCGETSLLANQVAGSAFFCTADNRVYWDGRELEEVWAEAGDFAPAYAVAHSFAMSIVVSLEPADPQRAVLAADCFVGVWARDVFDAAPSRERSIYLSAGDLDEGILGLLLVSPTAPDAADVAAVASFARAAEYGRGFFQGISACRV